MMVAIFIVVVFFLLRWASSPSAVKLGFVGDRVNTADAKNREDEFKRRREAQKRASSGLPSYGQDLSAESRARAAAAVSAMRGDGDVVDIQKVRSMALEAQAAQHARIHQRLEDARRGSSELQEAA